MVNVLYKEGELIFTGQNTGRFLMTQEEVNALVISIVNASLTKYEYTQVDCGFEAKWACTGCLFLKKDDRVFEVMDLQNLSDMSLLAGLIERLTR